MKWRPPSLSELSSIIFNMELAHLGSEASIYFYMKNTLIQFSEDITHHTLVYRNSKIFLHTQFQKDKYIWRPPRKSGLTPKTNKTRIIRYTIIQLP